MFSINLKSYDLKFWLNAIGKGGPIANVRHPQVVEAHPMEMEKDDAHCRLQNWWLYQMRTYVDISD